MNITFSEELFHVSANEKKANSIKERSLVDAVTKELELVLGVVCGASDDDGESEYSNTFCKDGNTIEEIKEAYRQAKRTNSN